MNNGISKIRTENVPITWYIWEQSGSTPSWNLYRCHLVFGDPKVFERSEYNLVIEYWYQGIAVICLKEGTKSKACVLLVHKKWWGKMQTLSLEGELIPPTGRKENNKREPKYLFTHSVWSRTFSSYLMANSKPWHFPHNLWVGIHKSYSYSVRYKQSPLPKVIPSHVSHNNVCLKLQRFDLSQPDAMRLLSGSTRLL